MQVRKQISVCQDPRFNSSERQEHQQKNKGRKEEEEASTQVAAS